MERKFDKEHLKQVENYIKSLTEELIEGLNSGNEFDTEMAYNACIFIRKQMEGVVTYRSCLARTLMSYERFSDEDKRHLPIDGVHPVYIDESEDDEDEDAPTTDAGSEVLQDLFEALKKHAKKRK